MLLLLALALLHQASGQQVVAGLFRVYRYASPYESTQTLTPAAVQAREGGPVVSFKY